MKMNFDKYDALEKIGGGLLGVIAIGATIAELILGGITAASIAGAIKDIAGTLIVVMVLLAALKQLFPKKATDFKGTFAVEMQKITTKYDSLIEKDDVKEGRFNIADNMNVLFDGSSANFHTFFDFDYKQELSFVVSKTLFMGRSKEDFSEMQKNIVASIAKKVKEDYSIISEWKPTSTGFKLIFGHKLDTAEEAITVAEVIDKVVLLYIVECKK